MIDALLIAAVLVPGLGALGTRMAGRHAGLVAVGVAALAATPAVALVTLAADGRDGGLHAEWLPAAGLNVGLALDGLGAAASALVAFVGLAVVVYGRGYFATEQRAPSVHAGLLGFLAAMQALVLADGFLTLLVFWELVGAASARLIAFNREDPSAPGGAVRAFLTTRSADAGLYVALAALLAGSGSLGFDTPRPGGELGALVGLGLVLAAAGKSAQVPLQTWLAGAMAGPTPVSALLHSATMVAAGVLLLLRAQVPLDGWPLALAAWLGALTAVVAAAIALAQRDLKLVLASSTTSQLGLMFVAAGVGSPVAALFHLMAHAAGKAALFCGAGIFQHRRDSTSLAALAGAGRDDRSAMVLFALGALAIAAVVPLAPFFSKDAILVAAEHAHQPALFWLVALASAGSAAYLLRPVLVLWRGEGGSPGRRPQGRRWMLAGSALLVVAAVGGGVLHGPLASLLGESASRPTPLSLVVSLAAPLIGGLAVMLPRPSRAVRTAFRGQLATNTLLRAGVQRPVLALAEAAGGSRGMRSSLPGASVRFGGFEDAVLDRAVDATGSAVVGAAAAVDRFDGAAVDRTVEGVAAGTLAGAEAGDHLERSGLDRLVDGTARRVRRGGDRSRDLQSGQLYQYLRDTVLGAAALAAVLALVAVT